MRDDLQLIEDAAFFINLQEVLLGLNDASQPVVLRKPAPKKTHFLLNIIRKIPILTGFGNNAAGAGFAVLDIEKQFKHLTKSFKAWSQYLQITALVLAAVDFVRVPGIYFFSWVLNEKIPVSKPKNARWLHSGILLAFAGLALIAPMTAGTTGLVGAGIGFGVGILNLSRYFYRKSQVLKELSEIKEDFETEKQALLGLKEEARVIKLSLIHAIDTEEGFEATESAYLSGRDCLAQIAQKQEKLQSLYTAQCHFERKIQKRGPAALMDKLVGFLLGSSGLIGTVLTIYVPLSGLFILAGSAVFGCIYSGLRTSYPLINASSEKKSKVDGSTKSIMETLGSSGEAQGQLPESGLQEQGVIHHGRPHVVPSERKDGLLKDEDLSSCFHP